MLETVRILHTSDIHLGSDYFEPRHLDNAAGAWLVEVVDLAEKAAVDLLIVAGDLFDSPRISDSTVEFASEQFGKVSMPIVLLPGNHDCLVRESPYLMQSAFHGMPNIRTIVNPEGERMSFPHLDLAVWGRPHSDYSDFSPLEGVPERGSERWQVAVAHGHYAAHGLGIQSWKITDADLEVSNMDYIALGHRETFSRVGRNGVAAYYSGSPQQTGAVVMAELNIQTGIRVDQVSLDFPQGPT